MQEAKSHQHPTCPECPNFYSRISETYVDSLGVCNDFVSCVLLGLFLVGGGGWELLCGSDFAQCSTPRGEGRTCVLCSTLLS